MIIINSKEDCCGCEACVQICPHQCISVETDNHGFIYPKTHEEKCTGCGLCERICPIINQNNERKPIVVYATKNNDEIVRKNSSSGGVFHALASKIIQQGGVVFGAKFNKKWEVVHDYTETIDGIQAFQGSKYVQSHINNCYKVAEQFLKSSRKVLFSGTPCQIAGLKNFLRKDYTDLITIDIICHGTPSPRAWSEYIHEKLTINNLHFSDIHSISFRDKRNGWNNFGLSIFGEKISYYNTKDNDPFLKGFLHNIYLRPSCYFCKVKSLKSNSDITLGDFWGIEKYSPDLFDNNGISCVIINTTKGLRLFEQLNFKSIEFQKEVVEKENSAIHSSITLPKAQERYYRIKNKPFSQSVEKALKITFADRVKNKIRFLISR